MVQQVVLFEHDLLFISKVLAAANKEGAHISIVRNCDRLSENNSPSLIIVNLEIDTKPLLDILQHIIHEKKIPVIGYCSHTKTDIIKEAKEIGVQAMPRSAFVQTLHTLF